MFSWQTMPVCRHPILCLLAIWGSKPLTRLTGFPVIYDRLHRPQSYLLPSSLQSKTGTLDRYFIEVCEQRKRTTPIIPPFNQRQKKWNLPLLDATLSLLLNTAPNQAAVARLSAVSAEHAGAFLYAIPINVISMRMDDKSSK